MFIPKKMAQYVAMQYLYIYAYIGFDPSHICNFDSSIVVLMVISSNLWGNAHESRRLAAWFRCGYLYHFGSVFQSPDWQGGLRTMGESWDEWLRDEWKILYIDDTWSTVYMDDVWLRWIIM